VARAGGKVVASVINVALGAPLLAVCVIVLSGDVYFDTLDEKGQLKKWGVGNKIVAGLILLGWAYTIVRLFVG
jgi:hypothetical protein